MDSGGVQIRFIAVQSVSGQQGQPQAGVTPKKHPPGTRLFLHHSVCVLAQESQMYVDLWCFSVLYYLFLSRYCLETLLCCPACSLHAHVLFLENLADRF